ncbi:hypothetical protein EJ06DRAFT_281265 [Trichodelitschia bisporula]|uniref:Uncharacterized protein n=1 Tax=Trichodelitschia bisporula TaxID=703511 RepID=A0A6G1I5F0_9PEZI|nr:hypothetical protein EJ06DRAFT_281265 [Trichodelitschia bisporula]
MSHVSTPTPIPVVVLPDSQNHNSAPPFFLHEPTKLPPPRYPGQILHPYIYRAHSTQEQPHALMHVNHPSRANLCPAPRLDSLTTPGSRRSVQARDISNPPLPNQELRLHRTLYSKSHLSTILRHPSHAKSPSYYLASSASRIS